MGNIIFLNQKEELFAQLLHGFEGATNILTTSIIPEINWLVNQVCCNLLEKKNKNLDHFNIWLKFVTN